MSAGPTPVHLLTGFLGTFPLAQNANYNPNPAAPPLTFEKDIRPILKAHCFDCHGEGEKLKGGLDLRLRRLMLQGGDEGPVIVPGKPEKSSLVTRIYATGGGIMPPVASHKALTPDQKALLKRWIAEGAKYEGHWSFLPPRKVQLPTSKLQSTSQSAAKVNPVDTHVQRWGGGLPQYAVGHLDRVARIRAAVATVPGLAVCGAAYDGVGIPAVIASAHRAVQDLWD